jgi:hypothetical protein
MKFKALLLALVATLVVASGAAAKNGGGNGKSHAQTTHSQSAAHGSKHEGKGHATKALKVKKAKKHEAAVAEEAGDQLAPVDAVEPSAEKTNPAWTCKVLLEGLTFVADFGTNANGANAFGKCVSGVANGDEEEETTEVPAEPGAACEAVAPAPDVVETTEVTAADEDSSDTAEVPAADEDSSDTPEPPVCEPGDGTETTAPPAADGVGDTTGTETDTVSDTVSDPTVPSADDALLAAARDVKAFAASL